MMQIEHDGDQIVQTTLIMRNKYATDDQMIQDNNHSVDSEDQMIQDDENLDEEVRQIDAIMTKIRSSWTTPSVMNTAN